MKIILGSSSPRRKQILSRLFNDIEIIPPHIDESNLPDEKADVFTLRMAREKNLEILNRIDRTESGEILIITSDTIVEYRNIILQKPRDREHAVQILQMLQGKTHNVITAIGLTYILNGSVADTVCSLEKSPVFFKPLSASGIAAYLDATEYMDKAGAYAIQENGSMIIEKYEGSHTNIIGFPLRLFFKTAVEIELIKSLFNL
ncbi:MAG: septum formation protein Maf [Spirochaetes bacterium]|nr:septum formation protein Maf [Spirochaetota bacterium]